MKKLVTLLTVSMLLTYAMGFGNSSPDFPVRIGTVIETHTVSHYMYLHVMVDEEELWISTIAKYLPDDIGSGDKIAYSGGMVVQGFNSVALQKSFDTMLLVSKIKVLRDESPNSKEVNYK